MTNLRTILACAAMTVASACLSVADACTSAIISGRVTADGRPMMWKNRDTSNLNNCVRYMEGEKYSFIAITGYASQPRAVWTGTNEAGFSIMNTLSYNLNDESGPGSNRNGSIMTRALGICRTVEDFKNYLDTLPRPIHASANYGVMDAEGHAGYFETGNNGYTFFDIDDPAVAPHGYIVRSNFSVSGRFDEGGGYLRHQQADNNIFHASAAREITPQWIFRNLSRSFENPLIGIDLRDGLFNKPNTNGWTTEQDFIARRSSSCAAVIHGVKKGEDPRLTVMWTSIGYPPVTPFIPLWVAGADKKLPDAIFRKTEKGVSSPLCDAASILRDRVYSYKRGNNVDNYFNWELLHNQSGTGYMQQVERLEDSALKEIVNRVADIRSENAPDIGKIHSVYDDIDAILTDFYNRSFNISLR